MDGNEATARVAYSLSEVASIYPITPASVMGELADQWSAAGRPNLWGTVPEIVEMQSEAGAAGALHGSIHNGALTTSFTASQGLLLMIPNMFKIAGELTPCVIHVAARSVATHALSIFGDHSDVMSVRSTGWAMLSAGSVQEAHDFALVAHAATLRTRVPFVHFFDGFRTSHEIDKIAVLDEDDLSALMVDEDIAAFRAPWSHAVGSPGAGNRPEPRRLLPGSGGGEPLPRRRSRAPWPRSSTSWRPGRVAGTGWSDYVGAPDADRVIVLMGSGAGAAEETVESMVAAGEKVGVVKVRLYRPFPAVQFIDCTPLDGPFDRGVGQDQGARRHRGAALPRRGRVAGSGGRLPAGRSSIDDPGSSGAGTGCPPRNSAPHTLPRSSMSSDRPTPSGTSPSASATM